MIPPEIVKIILGVPRKNSTYQYALLGSHESWSGASLRGKQKQWSAKYSISRENLVRALNNKLAAENWEASSSLVRSRAANQNQRIWRRELVLTSPEGELILWPTGNILDEHDVKEGVLS